MNFISINYNDSTLDNYGHVSLKVGNDLEFKFESNNFEKDWFDCMKKVIVEFPNPTSYSSTVNHFIFDGAPYKSAYLVEVDGKYELSYDPKDYDNVEFFIKENHTPTWEELKNKYKDGN